MPSVISVKCVLRITFLRLCCLHGSVAILSVQHMRCFSVRMYELNGIQENNYMKLLVQVKLNLNFVCCEIWSLRLSVSS